MTDERTAVVIVGAGPAGLVLGRMLVLAGVPAVVLEARDRAYIESRVRAGVLEAGSVDLLDRIGVAERLHREAMVHHGVIFQFGGERTRIDFAALTDKAITIYGQQEVVKDLVAAHLDNGGDLRFGVDDVVVEGIESDAPFVTFRHEGAERRLRCELVAGCDGFHGVCRPRVPPAALAVHERAFPFSWLGILAAVAPSTDELIYASHDHGFALHSARSPSISRLYLQVDPDEDIAEWPDQRVWDELQVRLASPGWTLSQGPVLEKSITPMRSFVAEPMRHGRMFLVGDAAHIVPPTGAKGMNLAMADAAVLADAVVRWRRHGDESGLASYSERCLARVWRAQDFSMTMTGLFHRDPAADAFARRAQWARQQQVRTSQHAAAALAEQYVGLPIDVPVHR